MDINEIVNRIIWANTKIYDFWSNSHGWAPSNALDLISKSRLDWQISLSNSLKQWVKDDQISDGDLILAWANLGALLEGTLKLFLCVYYNSYTYDPIKDKKGNIIEPDILKLEYLKQLFNGKVVLDNSSFELIKKVQYHRNAIHAFKDRDIGNLKEFYNCLHDYLKFIDEINNRLPYPDDFGQLLIYPEINKFKLS